MTLADVTTHVRELPKNLEAEQVVLGSIILEPDYALPRVIDKIGPEHFYQRRHRVIFRTMRELFERAEPTDAISLANRLEEKGEMERAGGRMYLNELLDRVTTSTAVEYYAEIVRKKAALRALIEASGRLGELGYDEESDLGEVLDRAEAMIFEIASNGTQTDFVAVKDVLYDHIEELEELHRDPDKHTISGLSTGFPKLDAKIAGLNRSDLLIFAGRPGTGKTSLALAIARHVALKEQRAVGVFSLEMSHKQLIERLLCAEAKVNLHRLRSGFITADKWRDLALAAGKIHRADILIDDTPGASILEIRAKARRMAAQHALGLVVVDYMQLVESPTRRDVREQEVAHISRSLKKLARELDIPVIAVSQLNRGVEARESKRPRLADLRESGAIEQDADAVLFIYREDYYKDPNDPAIGDAEEAEVIIAKQRNGPTGAVKVTFNKKYASFYPILWGQTAQASAPAPTPPDDEQDED